MFDLDGNGVVDADEFDKVTEIIMKGTTVAKQHKTKKRQSNISRYFFGESKFLNFPKFWGSIVNMGVLYIYKIVHSNFRP